MTNEPNKNPGSRMRTILSSGEEASPTMNDTPISRLPQKKQEQPQPVPASTDTPPVVVSRPAGHSRMERAFRAFWTVTGAISLLVNGVLLAIVIYLLTSIATLQVTANDTGFKVLSGFYSNFERMERASIISSIPVEAQIPIDLTVPIQKTTQITLASDTTIANARVRINTTSLNIDAPAQVILPAGTVLEVALNFTVPVQGSVPVHLDVPVNIPLAQTQLQVPFAGLQNVVRPFLCMIEPNALNLDGLPICR